MKVRRRKGDKENTDILVPTLSVDMSESLASSFLRSFTHPRFATFSLYCVCVCVCGEGGGEGGGREGKEGYYVIHVRLSPDTPVVSHPVELCSRVGPD